MTHPRIVGRNKAFGRPMKELHEYESAYRKIGGIPAHRYIVEARLGRLLPSTAVVHHVDPSDKLTNKGLFVVCEDSAYHQLIEARTRALKACGNANWKKCRKCLRWDDPANMQSKEYEGPFAPQMKWWHYRYKGQCVDKNHPVKHTRSHTPRKRRHVAPWRENAAQLERERAAAFRATLASDTPIITSGDQDVCACGERRAKRHGIRHYCFGCGAQKRAGFVGRNPKARSAGTPNRSERPLSPLGSPTSLQETA